MFIFIFKIPTKLDLSNVIYVPLIGRGKNLLGFINMKVQFLLYFIFYIFILSTDFLSLQSIVLKFVVKSSFLTNVSGKYYFLIINKLGIVTFYNENS